MRWVLWPRDPDAAQGGDADPMGSGTGEVPDEVFDQMMRIIRGALGVPDAHQQGGTHA